MLAEARDKEGKIHPANGYMLVSMREETDSGIIVVHDPHSENYRSGVVVAVSSDETEPFEVDPGSFEWKPGELIYFTDFKTVDGHVLVHWIDVVAFKRFSEE